MKAKPKNDDLTPVRFNASANTRAGKRPALQSPPDASAEPITENRIRTIVEEVMENQLEILMARLTVSMRTMLNTELKSMRDEIKEMNDSMTFMNLKYEDMKKESKEDKQKIKNLQDQNNKMAITIQDVTGRLNYLEQQNRASNVEIQCVPQKSNESLVKIVTDLGKVIKHEVKDVDVSYCTRVMKSNSSNNRPKSIVVQFNSPRLRDSFLAAAVNFNKSKPVPEKLNSSHLGFVGEKSPIYIMEHLSPANKALHAATRIKAKEKGYKYVWTLGPWGQGHGIFTELAKHLEHILPSASALLFSAAMPPAFWAPYRPALA
ncbi:uncharacterized protein LOC125234192 [Leguminivora glycinivorella]|uniref:uncharacterized protein LOC125234192 n=1 Tax=Leguminivora glycinivorella TaxID=1035111 RepID=UPI00200FE320|nr:uncharacterized protein LOC125234192 [Leguminivora glycinivorella]